jgi:3-deoxy-D-manno-octulosonate 8-phosphate phosphatase (KDO 8-P phosphatase)
MTATLSNDSGPSFSEEVAKRASKIKLILMDVDGVLTDGKLSYLPNAQGEAIEFKFFNSHDGLGCHFCKHVGIKLGVISGRDSPATTERARNSGITYVFQGHLEKRASWDHILQDAGVTAEEAIFIGDDFTDVPLMKLAGLGCAVANARPEVKAAADYVTVAKGGEGAVREVIEVVLRSQNLWQTILEKYEMT